MVDFLDEWDVAPPSQKMGRAGAQADRLANIMGDGRTIRNRDLRALRLPSTALRRLREDGRVVKDGVGYRLVEVPETSPLRQIALRFPSGVACYETAQAFHGIGDTMSSHIVMALPRSMPRNQERVPGVSGLRLVSWNNPAMYRLGIEKVDVGGAPLLITNRHRTVADMWRPQANQDFEQAQAALILIASQEGRAGVNKVHTLAMKLGWGEQIRQAASIVVSAMENANAPSP